VLNIYRKFAFLIFQGTIAMPKVRWERRISFVANYIRFSRVQKCWKSVNIWQSHRV